MNRIDIQRRHGASEERPWEIVVRDQSELVLLRSTKTLTKADANRIAKALKYEGGTTGSVAITSEGREATTWVIEDGEYRLSVVEETTFEILVKQPGPGGDAVAEIEGVFVKDMEIRWVPEEEDPNRNNPTPTKGLPGS